VVFPVSKVDKEKDALDGAFTPMNDVDEEHWKLCESIPQLRTRCSNHVLDDSDVFDGLPISLQLVGRRFEDEKVLAVLEYIKTAARLPFVSFP
jgi:amidase